MRLGIFFSCFLFCCGVLRGQSVAFTHLENQPYNALENATSLTPDYAWQFMEELVPLSGFVYSSWGGYSMPQMGMTTAQIDLLTQNFDSDLSLQPCINLQHNIIDRNVDEEATPAENMQRSAQSAIAYVIEEDGGEEVLKVEWKNVRFIGGSPEDSLSFQVWCYASGVIEYRYGASHFVNPDLFQKFRVGFFEEDNNSLLYQVYLKGESSNPELTDNGFQNPLITGIPQEGTVYRFAPDHTIAILEQPENQVKAYPNPNLDGQLFLSHTETIDQYRLLNALGQRVAESENVQSMEAITIPDQKGVYFLELYAKNKIQQRKKIIRQ